MKHYRLLIAFLAIFGLLAAACGDDGGDDGGEESTADTSDLPTEVGEGEGALNIVAWPGYIEDGSTDENYDWVTGFEEETGCAGRGHTGRHLGRDGLADDQQRRVRPGDRLGRRQPAPHRRRDGAAGQHST